MALTPQNTVMVQQGYGPPTDASFTTAPADGEVYNDLITNLLWIRTGGTWREVETPLDQGLWSILGRPANASVAQTPVRTNGEWTGINGLADTAASLVTQVMTVTPVPIRPGDTITKVSMLVGATAAGTPTNSWAAVYAGTNVAAPALIAQTADGGSAAIAASARFDFVFTTGANAPFQVTAAQAPFGYVYVAVMSKATTVPSQVTVPHGAAAAQYAWFTNSPGASFAAATGALCFSAGSALTTTAPATLVAVAAKTTTPLYFLS